jgi:transcriptional regulator with XRE-family HTH domain
MNLKELRLRSGLKQKKIAEHLGITRNQYYYIENGVSKPKSSKVTLLATIFNCSELEILKAWEVKRNEKTDRGGTKVAKNA